MPTNLRTIYNNLKTFHGESPISPWAMTCIVERKKKPTFHDFSTRKKSVTRPTTRYLDYLQSPKHKNSFVELSRPFMTSTHKKNNSYVGYSKVSKPAKLLNLDPMTVLIEKLRDIKINHIRTTRVLASKPSDNKNLMIRLGAKDTQLPTNSNRCSFLLTRRQHFRTNTLD